MFVSGDSETFKLHVKVKLLQIELAIEYKILNALSNNIC